MTNRTLKIRIAVVIFEDGKFVASNADLEKTEPATLDELEGWSEKAPILRCIVTAEAPLPQVLEIEGKVEATT